MSLNAIWSNPITQKVAQSGPMRFAGGLFSKAVSLPGTLVFEELFKHNPWGDKNSAMYGKGPGSLEYQAALESADASGRFRPTEEDYLKTPPVSGSTFNTVLNTLANASPTNSQATETAKALEKYGFNENFDLEPTSDGNYSVVRSEVGQKADALLEARDNWLAKTANSPAAQAGVFSDDQRWNQHLMHQDWKEARKSGTLDQFAEQYPNSQTAKELAIRNRIPTSMDMEF